VCVCVCDSAATWLATVQYSRRRLEAVVGRISSRRPSILREYIYSSWVHARPLTSSSRWASAGYSLIIRARSYVESVFQLIESESFETARQLTWYPYHEGSLVLLTGLTWRRL
jgi:hypothetical protein